MRTLNRWIYRALQFAITALIAVMIVPVTLQIASRFVEFIPRYIWTEEVARFCLIWLVMLGATIAVRDGSHFDVDVLPTPASSRGRAVARMIVHVSIFLMALIFAGYGWSFAQFGYIQNSEMTGINMLTMYIAWPLAGITWLLFTVEKLADDVKLYLDGPR
jgi:TRAP-type C4-dicarboxylate transport system permease small subunit